MAKKKKKKSTKKSTPPPKKSAGVIKGLVILLIGVGIGWVFGYESGKDSVSISADGTPTRTSNTDGYGRSPGHPHYGHGHP